MARIDQQIQQRQYERDAKEKVRQEVYKKKQDATVCTGGEGGSAGERAQKSNEERHGKINLTRV